jgi:DNA polymerase III delta prime subunit
MLTSHLPSAGRCAILRFTKLSDKEVLKRMKEVLEAEKVSSEFVIVHCYRLLLRPVLMTCCLLLQISAYTEDGLEAILFTAQGGTMRRRTIRFPR